jgi:lysylphosphatidylglycerol synthase-like protein
MIRRALFLVGLAVVVYLIFELGLQPIMAMVQRVGWGFLPLSAVYAVYQVVRAWALRRSLVPPNSISLRDAIWVRVSGETFELISLIGPFASLPAKGWLVQECGLTLLDGYAASITEYLIYTFVSAALSLIALGYLIANFELPHALMNVAVIWMCAMAIFLAVSAIAIWRRYYLIGTLVHVTARLGVVRRWFHPNIHWVHQMEDRLLAVLRDRARQFATVAGIDLLAHSLLTFELYLMMRMFGLSFPILYPFLIDAGTKFSAVPFFFIPGQVGASEGIYSATFAILQLPAAAGFAVAVLRRMRSLLVSAAGLLTLSRLDTVKLDGHPSKAHPDRRPRLCTAHSLRANLLGIWSEEHGPGGSAAERAEATRRRQEVGESAPTLKNIQ